MLTGTAFVTGGSGFVGGAVIRHLVATGVGVRALARSDGAEAAVAGHGATPIRGDMRASRVLVDAMAGCDVVYHVAGVNRMCVSKTEEMFATNVEGTRRVVVAAADARVQRVVMTSSVSVLSPTVSAYARSKALGEAAGFAAGRECGVDVVAVQPASVQGPGRTEGSARLLLYLLRSERPWLVDIVVSVVDVDDCAEGHLAAAAAGEPGASYLLSGGAITTLGVLEILAEVAESTVRPRLVSRKTARAILALPALVGDLWPTPTPICREMLATLFATHDYDGAAAAKALGFSYRPVEVTLERAARWYRDEGLI